MNTSETDLESSSETMSETVIETSDKEKTETDDKLETKNLLESASETKKNHLQNENSTVLSDERNSIPQNELEKENSERENQLDDKNLVIDLDGEKEVENDLIENRDEIKTQTNIEDRKTSKDFENHKLVPNSREEQLAFLLKSIHQNPALINELVDNSVMEPESKKIKTEIQPEISSFGQPKLTADVQPNIQLEAQSQFKSNIQPIPLQLGKMTKLIGKLTSKYELTFFYFDLYIDILTTF